MLHHKRAETLIQGFSLFLFVLADFKCETANAPRFLQFCIPSLSPPFSAQKFVENLAIENAPNYLVGCITKRKISYHFDIKAFV